MKFLLRFATSSLFHSSLVETKYDHNVISVL